MLTNEKLLEYYNSHKKDYPVVFAQTDKGIIMTRGEGENAFAYLDGKSYEVYPSDEMPFVFVNNLEQDAEKYQLEYDENDARLILDTFVDCVYLQLNRIKRDAEYLMRVIEGKEGNL